MLTNDIENLKFESIFRPSQWVTWTIFRVKNVLWFLKVALKLFKVFSLKGQLLHLLSAPQFSKRTQNKKKRNLGAKWGSFLPFWIQISVSILFQICFALFRVCVCIEFYLNTTFFVLILGPIFVKYNTSTKHILSC